MSSNEPTFELPKNIEHYLAALSKLYAQDGKKHLQNIIVNSQIRVNEGCVQDGWNGDMYGHALYLALPEAIYLGLLENKTILQGLISEDLNRLHSSQNEYISSVFLEMEITEDHDWRRESGLLLSGERSIVPEAVSRVWGDAGYRLFLSHKS